MNKDSICSYLLYFTSLSDLIFLMYDRTKLDKNENLEN